MMGKEGYFFDVRSSTEHRTSAKSLTDFCQERITQFRNFLVAVTVQSFSKTPHFPSFTCIGFLVERKQQWHLEYSRPPFGFDVAGKSIKRGCVYGMAPFPRKNKENEK